MWSSEVVVGEPIHKLHVEILVTCEGMSVEEVVIDDFPESLYLSIGLRTTYLGVFMDYTQFHEYLLKAMLCSGSCSIVCMCRKLESITHYLT